MAVDLFVSIKVVVNFETMVSKINELIEETKNKPRSIDNSFNIEYELNQFNVDVIIDKIKTKINNFESDRKNNENVISYYQELKKILNAINYSEGFGLI